MGCGAVDSAAHRVRRPYFLQHEAQSLPQHLAQASALLQQEPSQLLPACSCLCAQPIRPIAAIAIAAATISLFFMFVFLSLWGRWCARDDVPTGGTAEILYGFSPRPETGCIGMIDMERCFMNLDSDSCAGRARPRVEVEGE